MNARFVEKILNTGETEDTPQKSTCTGHFGIAKFVETKTIIIWSRFGQKHQLVKITFPNSFFQDKNIC